MTFVNGNNLKGGQPDGRLAIPANSSPFLSNGNAGWATGEQDVGICHAEYMEGLRSTQAKVRLVAPVARRAVSRARIVKVVAKEVNG
ncbi:MAG: hypothetical protein ACN6PR_15275 [Achromobacter sp.]